MSMHKKHLLKPTPFFILSLLGILYLLFELITSGFVVEGWVYRIKNLLLPVILFMIAADVLLKYFIKKTRRILVIELILLLGVIYYWIVT